MKQKQHGNAGYRLGLFVRDLRVWDARLANIAQRRGILRWVAKIPALLILAVIVGLLMVGVVFIAGFLILTLLIGLFISGILKRKYAGSDEVLAGGHAVGPEGSGYYMGGRKISGDE